MFRLIVALATLTLVALPAAADAKTLRGKTSHGRTATLVLDSKGVPKRLKVGWNLACGRHKGNDPTSTTFLRKFDQATADVLRDADTGTARLDNGFRVRNRGSVSGQRNGASWSGTFSIVRTFYRKNGKQYDRCKALNVTWSVS
jgi:hypothetical protein